MGMALTMTSALFQTYSQNQALIEKGKANQQQARNYITSMNYSFQSLEQQRQDAFEATIAELENIRIQGNRLESQVAAAVNEGMEGGGRTADLIKRSAQADTNRAYTSTQASYSKKSNEIDLNKEAALLNAKQQIASIQEVQKPSLFGTVFNLAATYYKAREHQEYLDMMRDKAMINNNGSGDIKIEASSIPMSSFTTNDWNREFDLTNRFTHYSLDSYKNPYAGVQRHYW